MKIEHLEVWHWQGLENRSLTELSDRITLVLGPNGAGKSRCFTALEAAFFEHHTGNAAHKRAWQTLDSQESPRVQVRFTLGGTTWTLEKQFVKAQFAKLVGEGATYKDEDAERKLQELIGSTGAGGRSVADKKIKGIWPLLWVPQHRSHRAPSDYLNDTSRGRLDDVLSAEAGVVTAGPLGDRVLEQANAEFARYYTLKSEKPTKEYTRVQAALDEAELALAQAVAERESIRENAEKLAATRDRQEEAERKLRDVTAKLQEAREQRQEAESYAEELEKREAVIRERQLEVDKAQAALDARTQREQDLAEICKEADALAPQLERARARLETAEAAVKEAEEQVATRTEAARSAQEAARQADQAAERLRLVGQLEEITDRIARAEKDESALAEIVRELAGLTMDKSALARLESLEQARRDAAVALEASAAKVRVEALRDTTLDGETLSASDPREFLVTRARAFSIGDVVEITVEPGGDELADRQQAARQAESLLDAALAELRVENLAEARDQLDRRVELEREKDLLGNTMDNLVPEGLAAHRSKRDELQGALDSLGGADEPGDLEPDTEAARQAAHEAQDRLNAASTRRATAVDERSEARSLVSGLQATAEQYGERIAQLEQRLQDGSDVESLAAALTKARERLAVADTQRELAAKELQARDLDGLIANCRRLEQARKNWENDRSELGSRVAELRGALGRLDTQELHEQVQDAEARVAAARRERDRIERRARAAATLRRTLLEARDRTRDAVLSLVHGRVEPYLSSVLPHHTLRVEEDWNIAGVRATQDGQDLDFQALSGGFKEQVSLVVRFALAESMAFDEPLPIVLDDPLVHTDPERLQTMIRLIHKAADKNLQLILLSCDEADYSELGEDKRIRLG